ncbi:peptidylprolyl isomerase [Gimesia algae]|uniref:peptidylprolyl isomerase n=1 Tax=Gimesia algae TaxID=2527971 RepID=A0A517VIC7_9PLAN|nr:peptidylprolyl isomerase [Gimesia algae]QDT92763.1 Putative peptidyl-prolyl cis-trans isomerase [Gimesia algae]
MISKLIDNLWRPRRSKHHRRLKATTAPLTATEKLEDRTLLSGQDLVAFAQALTAANVTLYGAAWDANTTEQKTMLEDGAQFLQFVEITDVNRELNAIADAEGIESVSPVWKLDNGTLIDGSTINSAADLAAATGVAIPLSDDPFLKAIDDQNFYSGTALHVALDGYDSENSALTYTVESSNNQISARVLTGNRSIRISVEGYGDMVFELFEGRSSRAAERIILLAESGFYDDVIFHRIVNDFMIQTGDPTGTGSGVTTLGYFNDQFHPELQHVQTGLLSMAKTLDDDTNDSQFFVTEGPSRHLDFQHTIFGYLIEGEDVREAISNISVTGQTPNFSITMETVDVFSDLDNGTLVLTAAEGYTGSTTITVTVADQDGNTSQREFQVNVTPDAISELSDSENANPYLSDIPTLQVSPGATITYQLEATDIDLNATNGNTYFVFMDQSYLNAYELYVPVDAHPELIYSVHSSSGLLTVKPAAGLAPGTYSITVAVGILPNRSDIDYQVLTVLVGNPPVANDDFFAMQGETPTTGNLLTNDTDSGGTVDENTTSIEIVEQPEHGIVTANADGTVNYTADGSGYMGLGSFTYRLKDNLGLVSNTATVNFSIAPEGVILVTTLLDKVTADQKVSLSEALHAANRDIIFDAAPKGNGADVIMFDPELFNGEENTISLTEVLSISDDITIIAPTSEAGAPLLTLNMTTENRHFNITDTDANVLEVSLQNLKLTNGQGNTDGGSISNAEHLTLINSQLVNNHSVNGFGGAIYNTGTLEISNSLFQSNSSQNSSGGAIASISGSVTLTDTTLDDNDVEGSGGGIYASNANVSLINSTLSLNSVSTGSGGGLYQLNGELTINGSLIVNNTSPSQAGGGGLYIDGATTLITGSTIHDNQSAGNAGGLAQTGGDLTIHSSTISRNSAELGRGGGIYNGAFTSLIINSTISGNSASVDGAGIYYSDPFDYVSTAIHNSTIADNHAGERGGGVFSAGDYAPVYNSIIADNSALSVGADVYGYLSGSYSLIENTEGVDIESATNFIENQDPSLLPLGDYGGLTQTHALNSTSVAIDAGNPAFDGSTFDPALTLDQRGVNRVIDGNNDSTVLIDMGAFEAEGIQGSADLTVKWQATNVGISGQTGSLPTNASFIDEFSPVIVEIWVSISNSSDYGLASAQVDFSFDATYLTADSIVYGPGFTLNQTGSINNETGAITGLGAATDLADYGAETLVLLARVRLTVNQIPLNAEGEYIHPVANLNFLISNTTLLSSQGAATVTEGAAVDLTLVPALYDLNDDGVINYRDLIAFVGAYNKTPGSPGSEIAWAVDYDRSGKVDYRDLILLASNYGKVQGGANLVVYPVNYSEVWQQDFLLASLINAEDSNAPALTTDEAEPVLEAAKQQLAAVYDDSVNETLSDVKIEIVQLPQNQLAKADASNNTIYLDINAAGWGWFVDQTPLLNEEFDVSTAGQFDAQLFSNAFGRIDLLTVLLHELNHLLGYEHSPDSPLMQPELNPGERKLLTDTDLESTDDFFGGFQTTDFNGIN